MIEQSWKVGLGGADDEICARIVEMLADMEALGVFAKVPVQAANDNPVQPCERG